MRASPNRPVDRLDTLSFYIVFLSSHINPKSVNSYLSGICRQLEPFYPEICQHRKSLLVSRTMAGCLRRFGTPTKHKKPFSHADLQHVLDSLPPTPSHDDLLFCAILLTGFHVLMCLGELVFPDKRALRKSHSGTRFKSLFSRLNTLSFYPPTVPQR